MLRRPFAKRATAIESRSGSISRVGTPSVDGEENGSLDVNFQSIEELLAQRLESLQSQIVKEQESTQKERKALNEDNKDDLQARASQLNRLRIQSNQTTVKEMIRSLQESRTEVSSQSRELLLAQIYRIIVAKPIEIQNEERPDEAVGEDEVCQLIKILTSGNYRSEAEFSLLLRATLSFLASDIEEFGVLVSADFQQELVKLVHEPANSIITNSIKANIITGYCALLTVLHNGSSSYGMDEKIDWLLDIAEGFEASSAQLATDLATGDREYSTLITDENEDKRIINDAKSKAMAESEVSIAALHGVGSLLTLVPRTDYRNEMITDIASKVVPLMDNDINIEISKAAGRLIALCYELYIYEDDNEDNEDNDDEYNYNSPYYEQEHLLSIIERLNTTKITKKEKKTTHSIFRDITNTIRNYTDSEAREEIYKKSPTGMTIINEQMDGTTIKLSKSKKLPVNSWFLYFRLIHLKWLFSFGVHSQLVGNPPIRDVLNEPKTSYQLKYNTNVADVEENDYDSSFSSMHRMNEKQRSNKIKKDRANKLAEEINDLDLKN